MGLATIYTDDYQVRRSAALPFVPVPLLDDVFLWVEEEVPTLPQAQAFHDYMVDTWVDDGATFPR